MSTTMFVKQDVFDVIKTDSRKKVNKKTFRIHWNAKHYFQFVYCKD